MNFEKLLRTPGWRTTYKLNHKDLLLLPCLVYINISEASSFAFFYLRFRHAYLFWFETKLESKKISKNETEFTDCSGKYGHVESVH